MTDDISKPTGPQLAALKWLAARNADGIFDKHQVLVAAGQRAPVMRSTWSKLEKLGLVERYGEKLHRIRVTTAGEAIDLHGIREAESQYEEEEWEPSEF